MKKTIALLLSVLIFSTLFLTACGSKDSGSSVKDPMAGVSKEDVAVQAMIAYYSGDLASYLPVYMPEYETAVRLDIVDYDYDGEENRGEYLERAKAVTQEEIDEWAANYFSQKNHTYGMDATYKVTAEAKDTREVKDRDEFLDDYIVGEFYDSTYSSFTDFISVSQIQDVALVKVRVEFENTDDPSDDWGTTLEVRMVQINGAWKVVSSNLAGW